MTRLQALTAGLQTVEDVIAKLGPPDHDRPMPGGQPVLPNNLRPTRTRTYVRTLTYLQHSATVAIHVLVTGENRIRLMFTGKVRRRPTN